MPTIQFSKENLSWMHTFYSQTVEKPNKIVLQSYFYLLRSIDVFLVQYSFSALHNRGRVKSHLSNREETKIKSRTPIKGFTNSKSWYFCISKFCTECLKYKMNIILISSYCFLNEKKSSFDSHNKNFVPNWSEGQECLPFINRAESPSQKYVAWLSGCSTTCSPSLRGPYIMWLWNFEKFLSDTEKMVLRVRHPWSLS